MSSRFIEFDPLKSWIIRNLPFICFEINDPIDFISLSEMEKKRNKFIKRNMEVFHQIEILLFTNKRLFSKICKIFANIYEWEKEWNNGIPFYKSSDFDINKFIKNSDIKFLRSIFYTAKQINENIDNELLDLFSMIDIDKKLIENLIEMEE